MDVAPLMDRLSLLSQTAHRTWTLNAAFGCQWTPEQIAERFADEDIDLIIAWQEHASQGE